MVEIDPQAFLAILEDLDKQNLLIKLMGYRPILPLINQDSYRCGVQGGKLNLGHREQPWPHQKHI